MKRVLFLLGHFEERDVEWMIKNGQKLEFEIGDRVITKDEYVDNLYIVLSGQLSITDGFSQKNIALVGPGEVLGEMSFLESRPPSVSVIASEKTELFSISKSVINGRLDENKEFRANFYYSLALFLSNRLRKTTEQLGYGNPEEEDVIDTNVLDGVAQAGARFSQILKKFSEV